MARIRQINPDSWTDDKLSDLSVGAHLLWVGTVSLADDEGRLKWLERELLAKLFAIKREVSLDDVLAWMDELVERDLIRVYEANGKRYGYHPNWASHQFVSRPAVSKLPGPGSNDAGLPRDATPRAPRIPDAVKCAVAVRLGCKRGENSAAHCAQCNAVGLVLWGKRGDGRPASYVTLKDLDWYCVADEQRDGFVTAEQVQLVCRRCARKRVDERPTLAAAYSPTHRALPTNGPIAAFSSAAIEFQSALEFARWFVTEAIKSGALPPDRGLDLEAEARKQFAYYGPDAHALLKSYGRDEIEKRARRFFALKISKRGFRRPVNIGTFREAWDWADVARDRVGDTTDIPDAQRAVAELFPAEAM